MLEVVHRNPPTQQATETLAGGQGIDRASVADLVFNRTIN
jgi:hypothetical protein